jgi:hypothetical protein
MAVQSSGSYDRNAVLASASYAQSITVAAGSNRRLWLALVAGRFLKTTQSTPTYAGVAMTEIADSTGGSAIRVTIYELVDPPVGTANFAVTNPSNTNEGAWFYIVLDDATGTSTSAFIDMGPTPGATTATPSATVSAGQIGFVAGGSAAYAGGGVLSGTTAIGSVYYGTCAGYREGAAPGLGTWSNNQVAACTVVCSMGGGDTTPPTLTSPTGTGGLGVCSGTVSTDEGNGTLYAVATASATQPSIAQIKAGQDHTGAAALRAVSQSVTATGTQTVASGSITGGAGTRYLHYLHTDAASNDSNRVTSASFEVTAAATSLVVTVPDAAGQSGFAAAVLSTAAPTTGSTVIRTATSLTFNGSGQTTIDITGLGIAVGAYRWVTLTNSNGTPSQSPAPVAASGPVIAS